MKRNKILVAGGAGFIGSHLCERLISDGNNVIALDNLFTGNKQNIQNIDHNPNFELTQHDITMPLYKEVDQIYNLACSSARAHHDADPVGLLKTSVIGTINLLELAKRLRIKIVHTSSAKIYGDTNISPIPEEFFGNVNTIGHRSAYQEGKRVAETLMAAYRSQYGIDTRILRLFNVYGPRMPLDDGRIIPTFIVNALRGQNIVINGNGTQSRCFLYVDDAVEALIKMMNMPDKDQLRPINIGGVNEMSVDTIANMIKSLTGSKSKIIRLNNMTDSAEHLIPNISAAERELGWQPLVPVEEGLIRTIKYFEQMLSSANQSYRFMSWVEMA